MKQMMKYLKLCYLAAFILGLILIFSSYHLGDFCSRSYFPGGGGWSTDWEMAVEKMEIFRTAGTVLALVSGYGLVSELSKRNR